MILTVEIIVMLFISNFSFGTLGEENKGSLSGIITDTEMNPIQKARVTIKCGNFCFTNYSNENGFYYIDNIPIVDCYWNITIYKYGYKITYSELSIDENTTHDFVLSICDTIYVDDDNIEGPWDGSREHPYQYIQDGIDNASQEDTVYVFNGIYNESITIYNSIILEGEDKNLTIIKGFVNISSNGVIFSDFFVKGSNCIIMNNNEKCIISNNLLIKGKNGIKMKNSQKNIIKNNLIAEIQSEGIYLDSCNNNMIVNNQFQLIYDSWIIIRSIPYEHIFIEESNNNIIFGNDIYGERSFSLKISVFSIKIIDSTNNTIGLNNIYNYPKSFDNGENNWYFVFWGNYWADYEEKYPNAHIRIIRSLIWNTSYEISDGDNVDLYPLSIPYSEDNLLFFLPDFFYRLFYFLKHQT